MFLSGLHANNGEDVITPGYWVRHLELPAVKPGEDGIGKRFCTGVGIGIGVRPTSWEGPAEDQSIGLFIPCLRPDTPIRDQLLSSEYRNTDRIVPALAVLRVCRICPLVK